MLATGGSNDLFLTRVELRNTLCLGRHAEPPAGAFTSRRLYPCRAGVEHPRCLLSLEAVKNQTSKPTQSKDTAVYAANFRHLQGIKTYRVLPVNSES
ncbi:hypothetical protein EVAR_12229_1 [Eumeta japonica]|uniref:Uncharacterized protein n=1 Tax=Eumeta variegata TaxID=151549 RepID=A0A4C1UHG1_EUMVA|nr:hypothetical protein EVAR_12229_1 [Eumeta japonica]